MPALVAGIHVFLCGTSASKAWMAGTSPAMTPEKCEMYGNARNAAHAQPRCSLVLLGGLPMPARPGRSDSRGQSPMRATCPTGKALLPRYARYPRAPDEIALR